jgi:iron complex transport system substrate-binding protein
MRRASHPSQQFASKHNTSHQEGQMSNFPKLSAALAAICMAAPVLADPVTIATALGEASVEQTPQTIAVLDIAAVDTLTALGVTVAGMPATTFVSYLADVSAAATPVGSLFESDFEAIANLNPDLIIVGGRSSTQVEPLSEIAQTIDMTVTGDDHIEQVLARLEAYGELFGRQDVAGELEAAFNEKLETLRSVIDGRGTGLVVMTNGPKVSAYGAGSRFGWLHAGTGLPEAVEGVDAQTHGEAISFEFIAEANPDWLIVVDRGDAIGQDGDAAAVTLDNPLVAGTTAWANDQVIYLNSANVYIAGGGYTAMMQTMDLLIAGFGGGA